MSFCLLVAAARPSSSLKSLARQAESALDSLYPTHSVMRQNWDWCSIVTSQSPRDRRAACVLSQDSNKAWVSAGSWFYGSELASGQEYALLTQANQCGFDKILKDMEGVFSIALLDRAARRMEIAVDPAGSYHVYRAQVGSVLLFSDSALMLAAITGAELNPEGVHQFVATGIVYGQQSVWKNFVKLAPAEHIVLEAFTPHRSHRTYWHFSHIQPEKYTAKDAAAKIIDTLTSTATTIHNHFPRALCDLTGGYDSRFLISGFIAGKIPVSTTVSGSEDSPDAKVAQTIATHFALPHRRVERKTTRTYNDLYNALLLTDGEYDLFEYAGVAATHHSHVQAGHDISLNGSFGELARGYWWELLVPHTGSRTPLDSRNLSQKRFAAVSYNRSIFSEELAKIDLVTSLADMVDLKNQTLQSFPNTTQMDHAYFSMRMQRWQGRIASSTNRIWPAVSPLAFRPILQLLLETKTDARLRSLVVRILFANHLPELGKLPMEHGYPAMPARFGNILQFAPIIPYYSNRITERLTRRWRRPASSKADSMPNYSDDPQFMPILAVPHLCASGLFTPETLQAFMLAPENQKGSEQWRRLFTLEMMAAKVHELSKPS